MSFPINISLVDEDSGEVVEYVQKGALSVPDSGPISESPPSLSPAETEWTNSDVANAQAKSAQNTGPEHENSPFVIPAEPTAAPEAPAESPDKVPVEELPIARRNEIIRNPVNLVAKGPEASGAAKESK